LPLLNKNYWEWSSSALELSKQPIRKKLAKNWHQSLTAHIGTIEDDESSAREMAAHFTQYLKACKADENALSSLPPGRFLMPGDLEGSPALTFAPLSEDYKDTELSAMMERRYESYKSIVVKPFFREHFARLDRQIVLVDALQAMNAGTEAIQDLEHALADILQCFRPGQNSWASAILGARVERILFAATKADQLHHENHDRMEAFLNRLLKNAIERASYKGADIDVAALSVVRATREGTINEGSEELPVLIGIPIKGEAIDANPFNGDEEAAVFPGDLPQNPEALFDETKSHEVALNFVRFKPPKIERTEDGLKLSMPHIRLDRSLEFLFGDLLD
jgi:predicted YcjX-like family ATPase